MEKNKNLPVRPSVFSGVGGEHKMVETYAGDIAKVIENDREGLVKKIIHEEEGHEAEKKNLSPRSKKNELFMMIGVLLILIASAVLFLLFFKKNPDAVLIEKQFIPIIFNDKSVFMEVSALSKEEIAQTISSEINAAKIKEGEVEGIYLTENKQPLIGIGFRRFIVLIKSSFVPGDNTLFIQDNFLMGVVNSGMSVETNREGFFILLKVRSTPDIFDNLRFWERKMLADLHGFLGIKIDGDTNYLFTKEFQDGIINNKNARILYDKTGKIVLMYIFANDNSVIITNSQFATREIMLRLTSAKKKQ